MRTSGPFAPGITPDVDSNDLLPVQRVRRARIASAISAPLHTPLLPSVSPDDEYFDAQPPLRYADQPTQARNRQLSYATSRYETAGLPTVEARQRAITDVDGEPPIVVSPNAKGSGTKQLDPVTEKHMKALMYREVLGDDNPMHPRPGMNEADARKFAGLDELPSVTPPDAAVPPGVAGSTQPPPARPPGIKTPAEAHAANLNFKSNSAAMGLTEQQAREMWRVAREQNPQNEPKAQQQFNDTVAKYGADGHQLLDHWAGGGTLETFQFPTGRTTTTPAQPQILATPQLPTSTSDGVGGIAKLPSGAYITVDANGRRVGEPIARGAPLPSTVRPVMGAQQGYTLLPQLGPTPSLTPYAPGQYETPEQIANNAPMDQAEKRAQQRPYLIRDAHSATGGVPAGVGIPSVSPQPESPNVNLPASVDPNRRDYQPLKEPLPIATASAAPAAPPAAAPPPPQPQQAQPVAQPTSRPVVVQQQDDKVVQGFVYRRDPNNPAQYLKVGRAQQ